MADADNQPWFNGKDCAKFLGFVKHKDIIKKYVSSKNKDILKKAYINLLNKYGIESITTHPEYKKKK